MARWRTCTAVHLCSAAGSANCVDMLNVFGSVAALCVQAYTEQMLTAVCHWRCGVVAALWPQEG
jgi:hypothetical protein